MDVLTEPVVAGFDAEGDWHDGGNGRYAKKGWSSAKAAVLKLIRGAAAMAEAKDNRDGIDLTLRDGTPSISKLGNKPLRARYHNDTHAVVDVDGRPRLIRWDHFNEPDTPPTPETPVTQDMAEASTGDWWNRIPEPATTDWDQINEWQKSGDPVLVDKATEAFATNRTATRGWSSQIAKAITLGKLTPDQANDLYAPEGKGISATNKWRWADSLAPNGGGEDPWKPLPETLFHVTTSRSGVEASGLKTRSELGQQRGAGLGGGTSEAISFTEDWDTAVAIGAAIHEAIDVAAGRVTVADLIERARVGEHGSRPFLGNMFHYQNKGWEPGDPVVMPPDIDRYLPGGDRDDPEHRLDMYKSFALWRDNAGGPMDPLFFLSDADALANMDHDEVGVVIAHPVPGAMGTQLGGLGEWRVGFGEAVNIERVSWAEERPDYVAPVPEDPRAGKLFLKGDTVTDLTLLPPGIMFDDQSGERWTRTNAGAYRHTGNGREMSVGYLEGRETADGYPITVGAGRTFTVAEPWAAPVETPVTQDRPFRRSEDDYTFVSDTTQPWETRVARLAVERERVVAELGDPKYWFEHPDPLMMNKIWDAKAGMDPMPPTAVAAFDTLSRVEGFGTALTTLVREKAEQLGGTETQRMYTEQAGNEIADALTGFLAEDTEWASRNVDGPAVWASALEAIRGGDARILMKPSTVALAFKTDDGTAAVLKLERSDYNGDYYAPRKSGHVVITAGGRSLRDRQHATHRGNSDFATARAAIKKALDQSRKEMADSHRTPPTLQAWIDTMTAMGVDMGIDPDVRVGAGLPDIDEYTGEPDFTKLHEIDTTEFGNIKPKSVLGLTVNAGLAPYPKDWTSRLPPQIINVSAKTSERVGNASNRMFNGGNGNLLNVASVVAHPEHSSSVAHEFGHSMQKSIPGMYLGEMWHMLSRLADHPDEKTTESGYGRGTTIFEDGFGSEYSGRVYFASGDSDATDSERLSSARTFELFTTGVQTLYSTDRRGGLDADPRLTAFTTGMMGLIRDPDRVPRAGSAVMVPEPAKLPDRPSVGYAGIPEVQALRTARSYNTKEQWDERVAVGSLKLEAAAADATTKPVIRVESHAIEDIIGSGRVVSTVGGMRPNQARDRRYFEHQALGVPKATGNDDRPVYGTILTPNDLAWSSKEGDILILPKPGRLTGRVSVSKGSANYGNVAPVWADMAGSVSPQRAGAAWSNSPLTPIETQIHGPGGLSLDDVGRIAIPNPPQPGTPTAETIRKRLAAAGYTGIDVVEYPATWTKPEYGRDVIDTADYTGIKALPFDTILVDGKEHRVTDGHYTMVNGQQTWVPNDTPDAPVTQDMVATPDVTLDPVTGGDTTRFLASPPEGAAFAGSQREKAAVAIGERLGLPETEAAAAQAGLGNSWSGFLHDSPTVRGFQRLAAQEFGRESTLGVVDRAAGGIPDPANDVAAAMGKFQAGHPERDEAWVRGVMRAQYDATQAQLRDAGIGPDDTVTLYRGTGTNDTRTTPAPVTAYGTDRRVAGIYGEVAESKVLAGDILSIGAVGHPGEVLVLAPDAPDTPISQDMVAAPDVEQGTLDAVTAEVRAASTAWMENNTPETADRYRKAFAAFEAATTKAETAAREQAAERKAMTERRAAAAETVGKVRLYGVTTEPNVSYSGGMPVRTSTYHAVDPDGKRVGIMLVERPDEKTTIGGETFLPNKIDHIEVAPGWQGKGVARLLYDAATRDLGSPPLHSTKLTPSGLRMARALGGPTVTGKPLPDKATVKQEDIIPDYLMSIGYVYKPDEVAGMRDLTPDAPVIQDRAVPPDATALVNGEQVKVGNGHYEVVNGVSTWVGDRTYPGMTGAEPGTKDAYGFRIPPAWTDVFIAEDSTGVNGMIARGVDSKGRHQYVYSAEHTANQAAVKFERIKQLNARLDELDARLEAEAMADDTAAALLLIRKLGMRPGSTADTKAAKQAYGATTLQARHVKVYPSGRTTFTFTGKKGVRIVVTSTDPTVHAVMSDRLSRKSGRDPLFATNASRANAWLDAVVGEEFHVKDLRTVKANAIALKLVKKRRSPKTMAEYKRMRNAIADEVAKALGNTRVVALASYINPTVFAPWELKVAS